MRTYAGKLVFVDIGTGHYELETPDGQTYRLVLNGFISTLADYHDQAVSLSCEEPEGNIHHTGGTMKPTLFVHQHNLPGEM